MLAADLGATHAHLAATDLEGTILAEESHAIAISDGPEAVLGWLEERLDVVAGAATGTLLGVGIGLPGPGRVRHRRADRAADHARMGRLPRSPPGWTSGSARPRSSTTTRT